MRRVFAPLLLLAALVAVGCGSAEQTDLGTTVDPSKGSSQAEVDAEIKRIDDNPHMPPEAKAAAKAAIQSQQKTGAGMEEAMQKAKGK